MEKIISFLVCVLILHTGMAQNPGKETIRVMSFNIRMDTQEDGVNQWDNRKDFACDMIRFHHPDLIGAQEVLHHQLTDMQHRLPEYESVGVGREDGKEKGEYSAVFFRKDRFKLIDRHTFWLAEDPETVGKKGWDAACERVVTWVELKDRKTNKTFYFFNTHFDHVGVIARRESSALLKAKISEIAANDPVIVTGDFNASPASSVVRALTDPDDAGHLTDSRQLAAFRYGPEYSFHDYGRLAPGQAEMIDYIFVRNVHCVLQSAVLTDTKGLLQVSDHYALLAVVEL